VGCLSPRLGRFIWGEERPKGEDCCPRRRLERPRRRLERPQRLSGNALPAKPYGYWLAETSPNVVRNVPNDIWNVPNGVGGVPDNIWELPNDIWKFPNHRVLAGTAH